MTLSLMAFIKNYKQNANKQSVIQQNDTNTENNIEQNAT
jgi:hypothetical protein